MAFVRPEEAVENFELRPGMTVADFGCGTGHYTIAAAKRVGEFGKVFAIDVQKDLLAALNGAAKVNNLKNIEIVWADLDKENGSKLKENSVDFVIISNILFQTERKNEIAKEALRILKQGGKTAVIEWDRIAGKTGPAEEHRISKEDSQTIFLQAGFKLEKEFQPGDSHYGLIFKKQ